MSRHEQRFELDVPPEEAMVACDEAVAGFGWRVLQRDARHLVSKEPGVSMLRMTWRVAANIDVAPIDGAAGSLVRLSGSNSPGAGPIQMKHLTRRMDELQHAIEAAALSSRTG